MSLDFFATLMGKQRHQGLLIDTNLLLLLLVGSLDPSLIRKEKITANQGFDEVDFNRLRDFASRFQKVFATPHILTEVSNHADKVKGANHKEFIRLFVSLIERLDEHSETSKLLSKTEAFARFGLTDAAISHLAMKKILVLTVDFPLTGYLRKQGLNVVNFNNFRQMPEADWKF
jgi:hypothetical protein